MGAAEHRRHVPVVRAFKLLTCLDVVVSSLLRFHSSKSRVVLQDQLTTISSRGEVSAMTRE